MNPYVFAGLVALALFIKFRPKAPAAARLDPSQFNEALRDKTAQLIDVRTGGEYATGHIEGALNIPVQNFSSRLSGLDKNRPVYLYCRSGHRSGMALSMALKNGFPQAKHLEGGIVAWQGAGLPVQR